MTKRTIYIAGQKTTVSVEDPFWNGFKEIASERDVTLSALAASINADRQHTNFSSAIRLFVLDHYRSRTGATADGPKPAPSAKGRQARSRPHRAGPA
jgi:predicted DNA-binding ribbon-helix-helix protein